MELEHFAFAAPGAVDVARERLGQKPFVMSGALGHWPVASWTFGDMAAMAGQDVVVPVEVSINGGDYRHHLANGAGLSQFKGFQPDVDVPLAVLIDHIAAAEDRAPFGHDIQEQPAMEEDWSLNPRRVALYLAQKDVHEVLPAVAEALGPLPFPELSACLYRCSVWLGPKGTSTPLHCDPYHNLFCQLIGRKKVVLFDPTWAAAMNLYTWPPVLRNTSQAMDVKSIQAPFLEVELHPGDVLHIPKKWFHHVDALSGSFSLSFWWP